MTACAQCSQLRIPPFFGSASKGPSERFEAGIRNNLLIGSFQ